MNKNYPSVTDHLKKQIGESFDKAYTDLKIDFRNELLEWFQKTYKEILGIKKEDELRKKRVIDTLNKNISDLWNIIERYDENLWSEKWKNLVDEITEPLPETVVEYQSEERFTEQEDDSYKLKIQKKLKRLARTVSMLFKKDKAGWKQVIQLKKSAKLELAGISQLPDELMGEEFEILSRAIGKLLEREPVKEQPQPSEAEANDSNQNEEESEEKNEPAADKSAPKKNEAENIEESGNNGYRVEVINKIESHLQNAIQILKNVEAESPISTRVYKECYQAAIKSGTVEDERKLLEEDQLNAKLVEKGSFLNKRQKEWQTFIKSQYSDFAIQIEIARFSFLADRAREEILGFTHRFFRDYGYLPLENTVTRIKEISEVLKKQKADKLPAKLVQELRSEISDKLSAELLETIGNQESQQHLIDQIQKTITDLQLGFYSFTETFTLAEKRSIENGKPQVKTDSVNWKKLATRYVQENALREMDPEKWEWVSFFKELSSESEEIMQVVDVNLLSAKESEKEKDEEESVLEIAISGTDRAVSQLEATIKRVRERQNSYEKIVKEDFPQSIQSLAESMLSRSYDDLEMQDKALQVKATAKNWRERFFKIYYKLLERFELLRRFFVKKFKEINNIVSRFLGFKDEGSVSTTEKRNLAEYLAKVNFHQKFPFVYKRMFSYEFEIDERFYIQPQGLFTYFEQSFEDWNLNIDTNFLIVGERGSGKTLSLKFIEKRFLEDEKTVFVNFRKTMHTEEELIHTISDAFGYENIETREELIDKIQKRRSRTVLVVENIHNIFVRNIHGFKGVESFWVLMASTRGKLFWVVTCSAFAWKFYEKMFGADQYFSHIVRTDNIDRDMLEKSILTRHKATGYELIFEPGAATERSRSFKKIMSNESEKQKYLHEQYFDRLNQVAEGNLSIAMNYWLQSIKEFDDRSVKQLPTEVADLDKLEVPSRDVLFTLAALVLHENLTETELAMSLHQDEAASRLMLARLKSKGIVQNDEDGYKLNHLIYRQVVRLLKRRNIIH
ncbi:ATP-binding protein [Rhodohalobacter sp.]|uniref:ATP-binding protein n=1 Tax=Rhodohalobacter sp. TaxID=1974210 RepID=UPI002ACE0071|nr:ATP-binding protein [Rhodohalobacter sp.]MDZ7757881.1 ATP-binding protein [Rhodohalobacter sp.]